MKNGLNKLGKYKIITIFITAIIILIRMFLEYAGKNKGLFLMHDYMYSIINYVIIMSALLIYFDNKKLRWIYWVLLIILTVINTIGIYKSIDNIQFQSQFTHKNNTFIIKETKDEPNFSLVYTKKHGIFIMLTDKIKVKNSYKPFLNTNYEVNWINDEKALIKFLEGANHTVKGEMLNFTKVNEEYSNVIGSLNGIWTDKNNKESTIIFDKGQITYKTGNKVYWYSASMADEQGSYGTMLYGTNDTPSIYLFKNKDNTITVGHIEFKNNKQSVYSK